MLRCMACQQVAVSNIDQEAGVAAPAWVLTDSVGIHYMSTPWYSLLGAAAANDVDNALDSL